MADACGLAQRILAAEEVDPALPSEHTEALRQRAHRAIPGGCHTYAKGDDQYPSNAPAFIERGSGCHVWDTDGRKFIEYGMGLRSVTLGHAYAPVIEAAARQLRLGANFNRPSPIEVEAAEALLAVLPRAEMVKFAKDGSTVVSAAIKLARAHTGRVKVAICSDHPFFAYHDWFMVTTGIPGGIPPAAAAETLVFPYNDLEAVERLFDAHPGEIACVLLEPARTDEPQAGYLQRLRDLAHRHGALFVLDETITGFRWAIAGGQEVFDVTPDLAAFGKALGNGFAVSALTGRRDIMELGGLRHARERVFLLSTTHGAETHALAAALAVVETYRREDVIGTLARQGERLARGVAEAVRAHGLERHLTLAGRSCALLYGTRGPDGQPSQAFRTLFLQELIRRGVLAPSFIVSFAHTDADIDRTVDAVAEACGVYRRALDEGVERWLEGPSVRPVYRRFN
jgi:glutamate-1-semialdehyde 2,1-aminomutase